MSDHLRFLLESTAIEKDLLQPSLKWMDGVELSDFFFWLENSLSKQNCIAPDELRTYNILSKSGKLVELEKRLDESNGMLAGNVDVYPHKNDLDELQNEIEDCEQQLVQFDGYQELLKKSIEGNPGRDDRKIERTLQRELEATKFLISGEYRRNVEALTSTFFALHNTRKLFSGNAASTNLICTSFLDAFLDCIEYLDTYVSNLSKHCQEEIDAQKENSDSFSSQEVYSTVKRLFNDCILMEVTIVELRAEIEGLSAVLANVDQPDFIATTVPHQPSPTAHRNQLTQVCSEHVRTKFGRNQVKFNREKLNRKTKLLSTFDQLKRVARPLKLCGDAVGAILKNECKCVRIVRTILSDCLTEFLELQQHILQSHKLLANRRTLHELSFSSGADSGISTTFLKFFDSGELLMNSTAEEVRSSFQPNSSFSSHDKKVAEAVMAKLYNGKLDSALQTLATFSEDTRNTLSAAKVGLSSLLKGPSAVPTLDVDLLSCLAQTKKSLTVSKGRLKKISFRYYELKASHETDLRSRLINQLWLQYHENPRLLEQATERVEEEAKILKNQHLLTLDKRQIDFLEDFLGL